MAALMLLRTAVKVIRTAISEVDDQEICGFLLGRQLCDDVHADIARPVENIYHSRWSFGISEREYAAVLEELSPRFELIGLYHSHLGSAHLSLQDKQSMSVGSLVWLVIGLRETQKGSQALDWRCFKRTEEGIKRLRVQMPDDWVARIT